MIDNNTSERFVLEPYISGGANRFTCPYCGQKKCFTRYIDTTTGEYLADHCGKCNHDNSCGANYTPRQLFSDNPELKQELLDCSRYNDNSPFLLNKSMPIKIVSKEIHQTEFYPFSWVLKAAQRTSIFRNWFEALPYDEDIIKQVLADYYVGATAKDIVKDGVNYGPATVFWMIDEQQRVHDAKLIAYKTDGHRVDGWGNSMRSICQKSGVGPQLEWTEKTLFGLHLLTKYPEKVVCLVESEKSALLCACRYPQFLWLATGGCGNLQPKKIRPLLNRRVIVYPDSGELDKWKEKMKATEHHNYTVMDFVEQYVPNTDIADIFLGEAKTKAEAEKDSILTEQKATWKKMKEHQPALQLLEEKLGLELITPSV